MNDLVTIFDGNPVTTTLILSEGTNNEHHSVIKLVRKYVDDLEEFGPCRFEIDMVNRKQGGGKPIEYAYLNEPQATLLMTYMSNTPIIREFKKRLVAAFFEMAAGRALSIHNTPQNPIHTKVTVNTTDLVREANRGNRFAQRLLNRLTGMQVDDIAAEIEHKLVVEDFRRAELAANYLDLLIEAENKHGLETGTTETGNGYLQGLPTQYFNAFRTLGKEHGLPMLAKGVEAFGAVLAREAAGLEFYGWRRSLAKTIKGRRFFRFERIGGMA